MNTDVLKHVRGESLFLDDYPVPNGTVYITIFDSPYAHGRITKIDCSQAKKLNGVIDVFTAEDIPGENQIGNIISDETLLASKTVEYIGEPIALIITEEPNIGKKAKEIIELEIEELPVITKPRDARKIGNLITPPVVFQNGDMSKFDECDFVVEGSVEISGQEHLYLETQGAIAFPKENDEIKIISSTQSPTAVQKITAKVLGVDMNKIEVEVSRLGGAFGGKEDQGTPWAVMAALVSHKLHRPSKITLSREEDLKMTGKRHPYEADYKIGLNNTGKIIAYEVSYYQNAGAFADLSTAILERTLFHTTGSYFIPNVKATGFICKTNLPPNTAFRGFGGPQGMFVIETAIYKAAEKIGIPAYVLQKKNLIEENQYFYYGQKAERVFAKKCWNLAEEKFDFNSKLMKIEKFNSENSLLKKGIAVMPVCFGISFTSSFLNQASALVHIYTDGSIGVSTAAVEMGQGVNDKIKSLVAKTFSVNKNRIKVETTNTTRVANTSPTAASTGADLNGNAAILASESILNRLKKHIADILKISSSDSIEIIDEKIYYNGDVTDIKWDDLISSAYFSRVSLSAQAYYATPNLNFDRKIKRGKPFAYYVYGTAFVESTIDVLRGTYKIDEVSVVHELGKSIDKKIDLGQTEGAIVQGIGWLTVEELIQNDNGKLISNSLSTYKIPDIYSTPERMNILFTEDDENPYGPFHSKAIGEPPFMYGIAAYFSILNAMKEVNPAATKIISTPITPEKVLMGIKKK